MTFPEDEDELLDAAWQALDEGRLEEAWALARRLPEDEGERWLLETWAALDAGDRRRATAFLERARDRLPADDPGVLGLEGELLLDAWRHEEAAERFRSAFEATGEATLLDRLSLCADLAGDRAEADRLAARAAALDPERFPLPARVPEREFEALVAEAAEALPEPFRSLLEETAVVIDPMPTRELVGGGEPDGHPPDLLGLFVGLAATDGEGPEGRGLPPAIYLFQRNLERHSADRDTLREEVHVTLYHELGHLLGFDEDGVDDLGLA